MQPEPDELSPSRVIPTTQDASELVQLAIDAAAGEVIAHLPAGFNRRSDGRLIVLHASDVRMEAIHPALTVVQALLHTASDSAVDLVLERAQEIKDGFPRPKARAAR